VSPSSFSWPVFSASALSCVVYCFRLVLNRSCITFPVTVKGACGCELKMVAAFSNHSDILPRGATWALAARAALMSLTS